MARDRNNETQITLNDITAWLTKSLKDEHKRKIINEDFTSEHSQIRAFFAVLDDITERIFAPGDPSKSNFENAMAFLKANENEEDVWQHHLSKPRNPGSQGPGKRR